ncbi:hypothetical protein [Streptomyces sp. NPDC054865]
MILLRFVIPRMANRLTGVEGSVPAASCTPYESRRDSDSVMCGGTFTARDGSFSLARASVDTTFDTPPTTPVATVVSGPDATEAVSAERRTWALPGATGLRCLAVAVRNVTSIARTVRASRLPPGRRRWRWLRRPVEGVPARYVTLERCASWWSKTKRTWPNPYGRACPPTATASRWPTTGTSASTWSAPADRTTSWSWT